MVAPGGGQPHQFLLLPPCKTLEQMADVMQGRGGLGALCRVTVGSSQVALPHPPPPLLMASLPRVLHDINPDRSSTGNLPLNNSLCFRELYSFFSRTDTQVSSLGERIEIKQQVSESSEVKGAFHG